VLDAVVDAGARPNRPGTSIDSKSFSARNQSMIFLATVRLPGPLRRGA
jgi:hypothetical protein